ncbi:MAG: FtsX-like permease family protein [Pseudomonadota bacterium]
MWRFLAVSWRDLWRNRRRTLLLGMVMMFCVWMMVFSAGVVDAGMEKMICGLTESGLGHARVQHRDYQEDPGFENRLEGEPLEAAMAALERTPGAAAWTPRIQTGGLVSKHLPEPEDPDDLDAYRAMSSEGAGVLGVDPGTERLVSTFADSVDLDDPASRCRRGCAAALAEVWVSDDGACGRLCAGAAAGFQGAACLAAAEPLCADRCPADDSFCDPAACEETLADYCEPARFLADRDPVPGEAHRGEIVLGAGLAEVLGVDVGDRVALTTGALQGRSFGALYRVAGLLRTRSVEVNRSFLLTHREKLAVGLGIPGAATALVISVDDLSRAEAYAERLDAALGEQDPLVALAWSQLAPELKGFVAIKRGGNRIMMALLVMIVGVILANVVTMSVLERTREYGVRMALGESPGRIGAGVQGEILILVVLAVAVGGLAGTGVNLYLHAVGMDMGMGVIEANGVLIETVYHPKATLSGFLWAAGTVTGFAVLGALYPVWRIRRLEVVDALRFH